MCAYASLFLPFLLTLLSSSLPSLPPLQGFYTVYGGIFRRIADEKEQYREEEEEQLPLFGKEEEEEEDVEEGEWEEKEEEEGGG